MFEDDRLFEVERCIKKLQEAICEAEIWLEPEDTLLQRGIVFLKESLFHTVNVFKQAEVKKKC